MITSKQININRRKFAVNVEIYNNAEQMVKDLTTRSITDVRFDDIEKRHLDEWQGVKSYGECLEYLANGYQPVIDKLRESVKPTAKANGKRIGFKNNVVGSMPIVPLAMIGVPNNMVDTYIKPIKAKVLDVYYDVTCNANVKSEQIIEAGQMALATILRLEQQGYKFNLYAVQTYSDERSCDMLAVKIKSSNQPLDLKRMSYPLTHTSFFRVLGFDWYNKTPKGKWRMARGHNISQEFDHDTNQTTEFFRQIFGNNAILLSAAILNKEHSKNSKEQYIERVISGK